MITVGIGGVTGYGGEELLRLLLRHPEVTITYTAASPRFEREVRVRELYPDLATDLRCVAFDARAAAQAAQVVFLALPHGQAMALAPQLLSAGARVIDLSGDFRLRDPSTYDRWYHTTHTAPQLLGEAVYGLTEYNRNDVREARLVANPGCYATSVLLGALPLLGLARLTMPLIIDAKSGYSGAGREAARKFQVEESANLRPYKALDEHQHLAEIHQAIEQVTGRDAALVFTPHIVCAERGLISDIYVVGANGLTPEAVQAAYVERYECEKLVRWRGTRALPGFQDVARTPRCEIGMKANLDALLIVSAIDNLGKGAASQAIQNMNVMCGFNETMGLL